MKIEECFLELDKKKIITPVCKVLIKPVYKQKHRPI
jgi:hypothetical protein